MRNALETDSSLRAYVRAKQGVAEALRNTRQLLGRTAGADDERVQELLSRLAEDRFHLVVLGEFKRGKSSLINAILGRELLPTAAIPLTSVVTSVRYGPVERVLVRRQGLRFAEEVAVGALADFVTERGNPGNEKRLSSAEVEAPAPFLSRGLHLVDTPGVGSLHARNTAVTYSFLPEADAVIFVTSAESPLSLAECDFLEAIRQHVRKVFFVLNKIDALEPAERLEAISFVEKALALRVGPGRVFPLSARQALAAKAAGDGAALASSGLPGLEAALAEFLRVERGTVFLTALVDRALRLVDESRFALDVRRRRSASTPEAAELERRLDAIDSNRQAAIARAREKVSTWCQDVLEPALQRFVEEARLHLADGLPQAVAAGHGLEAEDLDAHLRRRAREWLAERAIAWEREHARAISEAAEAAARDVGPDLDAAVEAVAQAAAAVFNLAVPVAAGPPGPGWRWRLPAFEEMPRAVAKTDLDDFAPAFPLPGFLLRRLALRSARRGIPVEARRAAAALRQRVRDYLERCARILDDSSAAEVRRERRRLAPAVGETRSAAPDDRPTHPAALEMDLRRLRERLARLRDALLRGEPIAELAGGPPARAAEPPVPEGTGPPFRRPPARWTEARTCPVCAAALDAVFDFLSRFQYDLATDPGTQDAFRLAGGWCPLHSWQLEELSSPRGLCGGYPPLLERTAERLEALLELPEATAKLRARGLVAPSDACEACRIRRQAEEAAASALVADLDTTEGRFRLERSHGLCLSHLTLVLPDLGHEARQALLRHESRRLVGVAESMHGYALRFDAARRDLLTRQERAAYRQAVVLLVGEKRVF